MTSGLNIFPAMMFVTAWATVICDQRLIETAKIKAVALRITFDGLI
jgi:hypothetical protein